MQQQIAAVTLGIDDIDRSRRFYVDGFGWRPVFENDEIVFYQMNGFVLGTWRKAALEGDMKRPAGVGGGAYALAHNTADKDQVDRVIASLISAGGTVLRPADAPPHGGYRGYVADPDGHAWEIAWNPDWPIDDEGHVTFASG